MKAKEYFEDNAKEWVKDQYNSSSYSCAKERIKTALNVIKGDNLGILDIGCGDGTFAAELSKLGHKVTAIDFSKEMIEMANKKALQTGQISNINFINTSIEDFTAQEKFDVITAFGVYEYIEDEISFIKKVKNMLKEGGLLLLDFRNKLFNLTPLSYHFTDEAKDKDLAREVQETLSIKIKKPDFEAKQHTPKEILRKFKNFKLIDFYGIHPHLEQTNLIWHSKFMGVFKNEK